MAETIQLHLQELRSSRDYVQNTQIVTGLELSDGQTIQGRKYDSKSASVTMELAWPTDKAERVAEFYEHFLAGPEPKDEGWNCHSFVAQAMGWPILWNKQDSTPFDMPVGRRVAANEFKDHHPYAITGLFTGKLNHSMIGLPDPKLGLAVSGFRNSLRVTRNRTSQAYYGIRIHELLEPQPRKRIAIPKGFSTKILG